MSKVITALERYLDYGLVAAEDQDTAVSDSFCESLALIMSVCGEVNEAIRTGDQASICMDLVRAAERAWYFERGVEHGLAIDEPQFKEALEYMRKAISSLQKSRDGGFQEEVYTIPRDMPILLNFNFAEVLPRAKSKYLANVDAPLRKWLEDAQHETDKLTEGVPAYTRDPVTNEPTTVGVSSSAKSGFHELGLHSDDKQQ